MASSLIKVALVQNNPQVGIGNKPKNLENTLFYIDKAAGEKANLVVFPELANTGYRFETRQEAFEHAESVEDGMSVKLWTEAAKAHNIHIIAGLAERDGPAIYNTAVLIGPEGLIGKYRKTHLWGIEKFWFTPGNAGFPVFETEFGRIGILICWDAWFPETVRIMGVQGADLICTVNNFTFSESVFDNTGKSMDYYLMRAHAHMNGMFVASANRIGSERGERFIGGSLLVDPLGLPVAAANSDEETMLVAEIDLIASRKTVWSRYNHIYGDRRIDLYDQLLGYRNGCVWPR